MNDILEENDETKSAKADDMVVVAILNAVAGWANPTFQDVARSIAKERTKPKDGLNMWRRYLKAVKQQAVHLAKNGRIEITRKGKAVDPKNFRGIVKMRLPQ
jgi:hypothetical protein